MRFLYILLFFALTACSDNNSHKDKTLPIANAGHSIMLQKGATAVLNGSGSFDPDGAEITYAWQIVSKPTASSSQLSDPTSPFPSIYLDQVGDYIIELIVNNGTVDSLPVTVTISDNDSVPVANAGLDKSSKGTNAITLDGSLSFDSDGDQLSYSWTLISMPEGSAAVLARADSPFPVLTPDISGNYEVQLIVSDGNNESSPDTVLISDQNIAPIADAGINTTFTVGSPLVLDGFRSSDADGDALSYQWRIVNAPTGSAAKILDDTSVKASITPDVSGDYVLSLQVNDGQLDSAISTVTLHQYNHPPVANAGTDISGQVSQIVHLDGSASNDGDGDPLTPRWSISSKPKNSAVTLADVHTMHPSFTLDVSGNYVVQLIVYDGHRFSLADTVTISTNNLTPTANAGMAQKTVTGQTISLDGSKSSDPEGNMLTYSWTLVSAPSTSTATLTDNNVVAPQFTPDVIGNYVFQLIVNDGEKSSAPATVIISDQDLPPIAQAGNDQSATTNTLVTLDGSTSSDPELQPLQYQWSMLSSPSGSATVINNSDSAIATITPDQSGDYVMQLTVIDAAGQKSSDVMVVRDSVNNTLPVAHAGNDLQVDLNVNLVLDGSGSVDADGDALTYSWSILSRPVGSSAQLQNSTSRNPNFTPDVEGDFVIQLFVSDGKSISLPDVIVIHDTEKNIAPVARIGSTLDGETGTPYVLDGSNSFDANNDTLTYKWILFTPPTSNVALNDNNIAQPSFTPDVTGDYTLAFAVNDGQLDSNWISARVKVNDPVKGAAIPLPPGHNLMMLSATGGESGSGSLISLQEKDLTKTTEILSLHGLPSMSTIDHSQSPVTHPTNNKIYLLADETGLNQLGAILEFNPETNTATIFLNLPEITQSGHKVRFYRNKILFHPDGKSMLIYSQKGGVNNAGVLFHINSDPASAAFKEISILTEFGQVQGSYAGSLTSPVSDLTWDGADKVIATFGFSRIQPRRPAIEITPSDSSDLSKPWSIAPFGSLVAIEGRKITFDNDSIILIETGSPLILTGHARNSDGGWSVRDCHNSEGTFPWGNVDIFIMCKGGGGFPPVLYRTNASAAKPVLERQFTNLIDREIQGVTASETRDTAYMNIVDESASSFIGFDAAALGIPIAAPTLSAVTKASYADQPIIIGGGDRGTLFLGDPAILNRPTDNINDRFVTTLSYDGGANKRGALITFDRLNNKINQLDFGFARGGFPYGRATKTSKGDYFFSTLSNSASSDNFGGATTFFDATAGVTQEVAPPKFFRPGIGLAEDSANILYGLGLERRRGVYALYSINPDTLAFNELGDFDSNSDHIPSYELVVNNDNLWFFTDNKLYCVEPTSMLRGVHNFTTAGPNDPVRAISFATHGADGFFATRQSATLNEGTIQKVSNDCAMPTTSDSVTGLIDIPSTALLAASDGNFYYGTENGKLMKFDGAYTVIEVAAITNTSMVGFLTEDTNGDIVGFASNGNPSEDQIYSYTLIGGAFTQSTVPANTPIGSFYPGVTEIN
ncbi:PKD domain-containing protein [Vibrio methylphosphonaticus]|uniref:PKD domain-containing protein n=1 Tax=Vibrio methylphosphonaticus TaxID=2946866 RepID=UPI002029FA72|nr:PKD domain-containing protein [Vibrio methylphosphonaticus]MCL9777425.1 PKD domain-containing protein [Vibrio methylphosphonaticus]